MSGFKGLFGGVVLALGGTWMLCALGWQTYLQHRARDWRAMEAVVLASRADWTFTAGKGSPARDHVVEVKYVFSLPEGRFEGDAHATHRWAMTRQEAAAEVARLAPGSTVTIHYDPDDPTRSAMHRLHPENERWLLGFGLLFLYVGTRQMRRSLEPSRGDRLV